jgi:hypothetical protein
VTRQQAIELARRFAKAKPQSYYSEPFQPHEWVVDAIVAAYLKGCYEASGEIDSLIHEMQPDPYQGHSAGCMCNDCKFQRALEGLSDSGDEKHE